MADVTTDPARDPDPEPARWISQQPVPVHSNLWLLKGRPPEDGRGVEVIVRDSTYTLDESERSRSAAAGTRP